MKIISTRDSGRKRSGFTLIEMLVSVALTLLMMVLFAQVFKQATDSMTRMKGMAENDQKARQLTILLRGDLQNRTFQDLKPFRYQPNVPEISDRRGYFSISENDPISGIDDVLQFTIQISSTELPLSARSVLLKETADTVDTVNKTIDLGSTTMTTEAYTFGEYLNLSASHRNQPEFDDGQSGPNDAGSSIAAEVCYYVRNGKLYRRMLLIRKPYDGSGQPGLLSGDYATNKSVNGSGRFWRDFDYSAFHRPKNSAVVFHTTDVSLSNQSQLGFETLFDGPPEVRYPISLGIPHLRFGGTVLSGGVPSNGAPREFIIPGNANSFIGRFNQQETAHSDFGYPGWIPGGGDPHDPNTVLSFDSASGLVVDFSNESHRRGEDVLLNNVHEFDIKVWDDHPSVRDWVDLGHSRQDASMSDVGFYHDSENRNTSFGNRFDTWHPGLGDAANPFPPYRPVSSAAPGSDMDYGVDGIDDDGVNGIDDAGELGWIGSDDEIPLRAIKITIRYFDESSNQMRQLTLVQSVLKP